MKKGNSQNLVSQAQFAKLCKVSAEAIRKACIAGKIDIEGEGRKKKIDLNGSSTIEYLHDKNSQRNKAAENSPKMEKSSIAVPDVASGQEKNNIAKNLPDQSLSSGSDSKSGGDFEIDLENSTDAEILKNLTVGKVKMLKEIEAMRLARQLRLKNRGALIERKLVTIFLGKIFTIEQNEIIPIADKSPAKIAAIFGVEDNEKILKVGKLLKNEIAKAFKHIEIRTEDFMEHIGSDVEGENVSR
jgi:hypothetical protein